ncbi:hypothetical protein E0500_038465 [Streptomyces sp. KM273126]|nr:hypothetical protein [Streptomyces sp. KM273126]MBA2813044.1 hypothetical protein [Streptomyces sp. KM273126]
MAADRCFSDLLSIRLTHSDTAARCREAGEQAMADLVRRAQEAGELRSDFVTEDHLLFLIANAAVTHLTKEPAPHAWRRLLAFLLAGCGATGPAPAGRVGTTPGGTRPALQRVHEGHRVCTGKGLTACARPGAKCRRRAPRPLSGQVFAGVFEA